MAHTKPQMIRLLLLATFAALSLLPTAATADSRHGMTERFHRIETMIALGLVHEGSDGFLKTDSQERSVTELVRRENEAREARYEAIVRERCVRQWPHDLRRQQLCRQQLSGEN